MVFLTNNQVISVELKPYILKMPYIHPKNNNNYVICEEIHLVFLIVASNLLHPKGDGPYEHQTIQGFDHFKH